MGVLPVAHVGDKCVGWCVFHGTQMAFIISGKPLTTVNALPNSTVGDMVIATCGCPGVIFTGNFLQFDHALPSARAGDFVTGMFTGNILTGSPVTFS